MGKLLLTFWRDESGQDLTEYTLLVTFVALVSAALFIAPASSVSAIWTNGNTQLSAAAVAAS
jgi:Flp pilus assembly pilin Flp